MEIERSHCPPSCLAGLYPQETKKVSWKWRLKGRTVHRRALRDYIHRKQRKSPENGDWKFSTPAQYSGYIPAAKQRKSPENGDWKSGQVGCFVDGLVTETKKVSWKWRLKACFDIVRQYVSLGNKESLLKMEIESEFHQKDNRHHVSGKQRKSPENGDWKTHLLHTKGR